MVLTDQVTAVREWAAMVPVPMEAECQEGMEIQDTVTPVGLAATIKTLVDQTPARSKVVKTGDGVTSGNFLCMNLKSGVNEIPLFLVQIQRQITSTLKSFFIPSKKSCSPCRGFAEKKIKDRIR